MFNFLTKNKPSQNQITIYSQFQKIGVSLSDDYQLSIHFPESNIWKYGTNSSRSYGHSQKYSEMSKELDEIKDGRSLREVFDLEIPTPDFLKEDLQANEKIQKNIRKMRPEELLLRGNRVYSPFNPQSPIFLGWSYVEEITTDDRDVLLKICVEEIPKVVHKNAEEIYRFYLLEYLTEIKGVTLGMALDLRDKYKTFEKIAEADPKELSKIPGIGSVLANRLTNLDVTGMDKQGYIENYTEVLWENVFKDLV